MESKIGTYLVCNGNDDTVPPSGNLTPSEQLDAASSKWIASYSKPCPRCKSVHCSYCITVLLIHHQQMSNREDGWL